MSQQPPETPQNSKPQSISPAPPEGTKQRGWRDGYSSLREPNYRRYFIGNVFALMGMQMTTFTVAYELYERTRSPFLMGFTGLVQVLPIIAFALPAGHLLDHVNRKTAMLWATGIQIIVFALLGFSSVMATDWQLPPVLAWLKDAHVAILFLLLVVHGCCRAINQPAKQAIMPLLVKPANFPNAVSLNSQLFELTNVIGPMTAGFTIAWLLTNKSLSTNSTHTYAYASIYWVNAIFQIVNWLNIARIHLPHTPRAKEPMTLQSMLGGARFVYANKVILSAITLDMFAVLLGGATMMLPVFAKQVIHPVGWLTFLNDGGGMFIGPVGLACLRASASVGSILMATIVNHRPPMQNAGRNLLVSVAGFGIATIVFGLSRNFWLSMVALFFTGFFDSISVIVRHSLVQLNTPDNMRGRVSAINSVFISASNELGEFESGVTTWLMMTILVSAGQGDSANALGPMIAVAVGGAGTCIVVAVAVMLWPQLRAVKRLDAKH